MKMSKTLAVMAVAVAGMAFGDIYMAGDSTMCNYAPRQYPQQGWGQALAEYMKDPDKLHNWAIGGRSAKSFKNEGRWQKIVDAIGKDDFVIIAFGHNDANKAKEDRYSSPEDYKVLMEGFIDDVRSKGATPILATSIPHSGGFSEQDGKMHVRGSAAGIGPYVAKTVELGKEKNVPVLDLNKYAEEHLPKLGLSEANRLYMRIAPNEYQNCPTGKSDGCHTRDTGAFFFAKAAVLLAAQQRLPICKLWKNPKTVEHTPIPWGGPGSDAKPMKDDFSKEEIPYANEEAANKTPQDEIMELRREAEAKGMMKEPAKRWAAQEYRRRHPGK